MRRELGFADYLGTLQRHCRAMDHSATQFHSAMKSILRDRLTTVFPRQGHYAFDITEMSAYPIPDITIEAIGDIGAMEERRWGSP